MWNFWILGIISFQCSIFEHWCLQILRKCISDGRISYILERQEDRFRGQGFLLTTLQIPLCIEPTVKYLAHSQVPRQPPDAMTNMYIEWQTFLLWKHKILEFEDTEPNPQPMQEHLCCHPWPVTRHQFEHILTPSAPECSKAASLCVVVL